MSSLTGAKPKPVLDENGFQQLLAAAYVLQQHNDSLRSKDPRLDPTWIFAQISETETLVRHGNLRLPEGASLIAERLSKMTGAVRAGVWRLDSEAIDCIAEGGIGKSSHGQSLAWSSEAAVTRLRNSRQFQSLNAQTDSRLDAALCRDLGIQSLLAVPINVSEELAGFIEVHWGLTNALHECDVRTCRLMADLVAELVSRKKGGGDIAESSGAPHLLPIARQAETQTATEVPPLAIVVDVRPKEFQTAAEAPETLASNCRLCGRAFAGEESFCGKCSMPRVASSSSNDGLQSKWASMWFMQKAQETTSPEQRPQAEATRPKNFAFVRPSPSLAFLQPKEETTSLVMAEPQLRTEDLPQQKTSRLPLEPEFEMVESATVGQAEFPAAQPSQTAVNWRAMLARIRSGVPVRLRLTRRTIALTAASLVAVLLASIWLSAPAAGSSQLGWFDSILVELGLAEVQQRAAPVFAGNPDVRVWEDIHTALYYCQGSELYGKTPGGQFSTQRAAQQDQFESATRVPCQ